MPHAIRIHATGGPEVLRWEDVGVGEPAPHEARVRHAAVGLNFIDIYFRTGLYPTPLPAGLGIEAAGVVEAVGSAVTEVKPGDTILIQAAAGGVGLIVCQWAKALGATVIGTVGSDDKAALARAHGCDHPIVYSRENFTQRVREITGGAGVPVVYDSIGKDTFTGSLDCLRPLGMMVSFGNSSGPVPPVDLLELGKRGSLFITRPSLMTYTAKRPDLLASAQELFAMVDSGRVRIEVNQTYALKDAAQAQIDLAARKTTGSTVLLP